MKTIESKSEHLERLWPSIAYTCPIITIDPKINNGDFVSIKREGVTFIGKCTCVDHSSGKCYILGHKFGNDSERFLDIHHLQKVIEKNPDLVSKISSTFTKLSECGFNHSCYNTGPASELFGIIDVLDSLSKINVKKTLGVFTSNLGSPNFENTINHIIDVAIELVCKLLSELKIREALITAKIESEKTIGIKSKIKALSELIDTSEYDKLKKQIKLSGWSPSLKEHLLSELSYANSLTGQSTHGYNYVKQCLSLPFNKSANVKVPISAISTSMRQLLKNCGFLENIDCILYDILKLKKQVFILLLGPPGVAKTTMVKILAKQLKRKLISISLNGIVDPKYLTGHHRTYIGATPGAIIEKIKHSKVCNPIILFDEIDKAGSERVISILMSCTDQVMNKDFTDQYIDMPYSLGDVLFFFTANDISGIHPALLSRLTVLRFDGYSLNEKREILERVGKKMQRVYGFQDFPLNKTVEQLLNRVKELGVRKSKMYLRMIMIKHSIKGQKIEKIIDSLLPISRTPINIRRIGVANCITVSSSGGEVSPIEVTHKAKERDGSRVTVTGNCMQTMKESIVNQFYAVFGESQTCLHIHVPFGGVYKDGPSAGVAIYMALLSMNLNRVINEKVCSSGEVTLTGAVCPIGGVKHKLDAAINRNMEYIFLPEDNKADVLKATSSPECYGDKINSIKIIYIAHVQEMEKHFDIIFN